MYLILCPSDKRIMHISTTIDYESNGNFILDNDLRVLATIAECVQVDSVPDYVEVEKYLYVNGEFVENPNYIDYIAELEEKAAAYDILTGVNE